MKTVGLYFSILNLTFLSTQSEDQKCLHTFHAFIHQSLCELLCDSLDLSVNEVRITFKLQVSNDGIVDSSFIVKSNLDSFSICESELATMLLGYCYPCLRDYYFDCYGYNAKYINIFFSSKKFGKNCAGP